MIKDRIKKVILDELDPYSGKTYADMDALKDIIIDESGNVAIRMGFGYPISRIKEQLTELLLSRLHEEGVKHVTLDMTWEVHPHQMREGLKNIPGVKNIVAVASSKGGVGKSTTAVNVALALAIEGARVGLLDADIYGPNQPQMLGIKKHPKIEPGRKLKPIVRYGLQSMSIGYLVDEKTPMIWRGPMVNMALQQFLYDTLWKDLDYLIIDLPPGTGDIQLTMAQKVPVSGAIIVTTPQHVAIVDARKGLEMFRKVNIPVLGIVENMSVFACPACGHREEIFDSGGGKQLAKENNIPLLGQLPLDLRIRKDADSGEPTVIADPRGMIAESYHQIARSIAARLSNVALT